jgi:hypothetical protein
MKEGSLFCFKIMRSTESGCFRSCSWCLWKALDEDGCMGLVPWCVQKFFNIEWFLHWKSNIVSLRYRKFNSCLKLCVNKLILICRTIPSPQVHQFDKTQLDFVRGLSRKEGKDLAIRVLDTNFPITNFLSVHFWKMNCELRL